MTGTIALAGDTMLGRGVAGSLMRDRAAPLVAPEVVEQLASADAVVLNLECCISDGGTPFPDPAKPFFFRAPPVAAERLAELGVDAVTLANNHAMDFGPQALLDTLRHLERAGVAAVGAGADDSCAREPLILRCGPLRVGVVAFSDHPEAYWPPPDNRESPTSTFAPGCRTGCQPRHDRDRSATRCSSRRTGGPTWSARR
jgi:poly-gamma-glutamate capsule biosynthesis protein CapA/YwtB (metallophosphatase superfamily)